VLSNTLASVRGTIEQPEGAAAVNRTITYNTVDAKLSIFLGQSAIDDVRRASPADTKSGRGRIGMGLGKGSGVLLPGVKASFLAKDAFGHDDGNCAIVTAIFIDCDIFFTLGSARLAIPASQLHGLVLPPCDCDARIARDM
jgi:hypothetical protein